MMAPLTQARIDEIAEELRNAASFMKSRLAIGLTAGQVLAQCDALASIADQLDEAVIPRGFQPHVIIGGLAELDEVAPRPTIRDIMDATCEALKIGRQCLTGRVNHAYAVFPRHIAMHLAHEMAGLSFPQIGADFGGRHHTTVMHADRAVRVALRNLEPRTMEAVSDVIRVINRKVFHNIETEKEAG